MPPQGLPGPPGGFQPGQAPVVPGRDIYRVIPRPLPDGRVVEFVYRLTTHTMPDMTAITAELIGAPMLDCTCYATGPEDVVMCFDCHAVVCSTRHSCTCMVCGQVACSSCLKGVMVHEVPVVVCKACAEELTASLARRAWRSLSRAVWGGET